MSSSAVCVLRFNRNIVECKLYPSAAGAFPHLGFNRNIVECKFVNCYIFISRAVGFNRNIVECKSDVALSALEGTQYLIET